MDAGVIFLENYRPCGSCKTSKPISNFAISKRDGTHSWCKCCCREYNRNYYQKNKESMDRKAREWRINNSERYRGYQQKYYQENRDRFNKLGAEWYRKNPEKAKEILQKYRSSEKGRAMVKKWKSKKQKDPSYRLANSISCSLRDALRDGKQGRRWESIVKYTLEDLTKHLESQFKEGMSWDNYGRGGWEIDHIRPVSSFKFSGVCDPAIVECWALENLQPLWGVENAKKGNKIIESP